ncbi:MAG: hypothetical protein M3Y39_12615, partial [Chloroflexota bacterium]|nr:hypothetical protein [Chloroflexota bacterium]
ALNDDSSGLRWIIKTELFPPAPEVVYQLARFGQILNAKCWLVIFDQIPSETLALAKNLKVMISGIEEWRQLKELFGLTSNLATK